MKVKIKSFLRNLKQIEIEFFNTIIINTAIHSLEDHFYHLSHYSSNFGFLHNTNLLNTWENDLLKTFSNSLE